MSEASFPCSRRPRPRACMPCANSRRSESIEAIIETYREAESDTQRLLLAGSRRRPARGTRERGALDARRATQCTRWRKATRSRNLSMTAGWPTRPRLPGDLPGGPWTIDAPSVARMREAGAVCCSARPVYPNSAPPGSTRSAPVRDHALNPWDPAMTPGGSSGGSFGCCGLPGWARLAPRFGCGRLDPHPGCGDRDIRYQDDVRARAGSPVELPRFARGDRTDHPHCRGQHHVHAGDQPG